MLVLMTQWHGVMITKDSEFFVRAGCSTSRVLKDSCLSHISRIAGQWHSMTTKMSPVSHKNKMRDKAESSVLIQVKFQEGGVL